MLVLNNPESIKQLADELNPKYIILGFPGAGDTYKNIIVNYIQIKQQEPTIGEINGETSIQIKDIKTRFKVQDLK